MIDFILRILFRVRPVKIAPRDKGWHDRRRALLAKITKQLSQ